MRARKRRASACAGVLAVAAVLAVAGGVWSRTSAPDACFSDAESQVAEPGARLADGLRERAQEAAAGSASGGGASESPDAAGPQGQSAGEAEVDTAPSPVSVPRGREVSWRSTRAGRSWTYATDQPARVVGKSLVAQLAGGAWMLEEAGFLGLDDGSWGCVARAVDGSGALVVHARPNVVGQAVGSDNPLIVSVARLDPVL